MKIHEYLAAELVKKSGIPTCPGEVATNVEEAQSIAKKLDFPVVLKAQVLTGGRGKAGGVKVVKNSDELAETFPQIKNLTIKGYPVEKFFVVQAVDIQKEFYMAVTIDPGHNDVVLIASSAGGVEIEETAKKHPEQIRKFYLQGKRDLNAGGFPEFIRSVFSDAKAQEQGTKIFQNLLKLFFQHDCSLAEINPLVIDKKGQWIAADAKITFDDNALFRHPDIQQLRDLKYEDPDELAAQQCSLSFVKMEGNVGCIVNGAGLAMATMDVIKLLGGEPANFLDVGGSSNPEKVLNAMKIIMRSKTVKVILINIFGGITRCDDIARGLLEARKQLGFPIPLIVRLTGTNEKEAKELLAQNQINTYSTMREVVQKAVELANKK